jgi:integrase
MLGAWWGELGRPDDSTLVFPGASATGYLDVHSCNDRLYDAMAAPDVPREDAAGDLRTFHSLGHTFASVALQEGRPITWVQRQLGHSSITVTVDRYGHFERDASRREAALLEGAFGLA